MILSPKYKCIWYILDNSHRLLLGICFYIFGLSSLLLNIWLASAFLQSPLLNTIRSHLLILNLCISCLARVVLAGFPFSGTSAIVGRWVFGEHCCQLFGFMKHLLGVFQMASLTLISIERYLICRRQSKADEISYAFYIIGIISCWLFASLWSVPPLFKIGSYRCDVTGMACDFDWRFATKQQTVFNYCVLIFAGILPLLIMWFCYWISSNSELRERQTYAQRRLTKTMMFVTIGILVFWTPQAIEVLWIVIGFARSPRIFPISLAVLAPLSSEASTLVPVLTYLAYDERIRVALLNLLPPFNQPPRFVR